MQTDSQESRETITEIAMVGPKTALGKPELRTIGVRRRRRPQRPVTKGSRSGRCSPWVFPGIVIGPEASEGKDKTTAEISHLSE